jgi:CRP-like cAMP-binding protein
MPDKERPAKEVIMLPSTNQILQHLGEPALSELRGSLKPADLVQGQQLAEPMKSTSQVYFPEGGVVSFVVKLADGGSVEAAMVGKDGVVGAMEAVHGTPFRNEAVVQVSGRALIVPSGRFREVYFARESVRNAVERHAAVFVAQAQQSAACNAMHEAKARLCRWLLRLHDLVGSEFSLTQEYMAELLGFRRPTVSVEAKQLQEEGLIKYQRGRIVIIDVDGLKRHSCECYQAVKEYEQLVLGN